MHVIFISMCEKNAISKTRKILDSFANRVGTTTWATPINKESLDVIKLALKKTATRQTAVACYKNEGLMRMKLIWTVGNKSTFGKNGEIAIATKSHTSNLPSVPWLNIACSVAKASGLGHDIGKANRDFQNKIDPNITSASQSDPVRHELVSAAIVHKMLHQKDWTEAWLDLQNENLCKYENVIGNKEFPPSFVAFLSTGITDFRDAILFCIATHHKLFSTLNDHTTKLNMDAHINTSSRDVDVLISNKNTNAVAKIATHLSAYILKKEQELQTPKILNNTPDFWHGVSLITRAALILADHKVSSRTPDEIKGIEQKQRHNALANDECFANTFQGAYNQPLAYHLEHVGSEAASMLRNMALFDPAGLGEESIDKINQAAEGRFEWQNLAVTALEAGAPSLVFNVAATGSGKTIMNSRAASVLAGEKPLRISVVLNLRSLTLQTGDSYKKDLGVGADELSVITGSHITRLLHDYEKADELNTKAEKSEVIDYEESLAEDYQHEVPAWIASNCKNNAQKAIVMAPMLVSTIDYLIFAGDPDKQAKHSLAILRLMHSDLIIDEIDGYEPKPLIAVLRLIKMSAMFGRNVIVSSATMPTLIAEKIFNSYQAGFAIYKAMNAFGKSFSSIIIDDSITPSKLTELDNFAEKYQQHIASMMLAASKKTITKRAEILNFEKTESNLYTAIKDNTKIMHQRHGWCISNEDKFKISFGLIRVANIKNAIKLANKIKSEKNVKVCCYHSRHFVIQRYFIEKSLNQLLNRKNKDNPNQNILQSEEIQNLIREHKSQDLTDLIIIVVATPVEEVGRDHDFDWAIIDPSSAQSLVQTAGRVNRHRLVEVAEPNIGILQFNFKEVLDPKTGRCFICPGYESEKSIGRGKTTHPSHDLNDLINKASIAERFDSDVRFCTLNSHPFSIYDTTSIGQTLNSYIEHIQNNKSSEWIGKGIYEKTPLRDKKNEKTIYFNPEKNNWFEDVLNDTGKKMPKEIDSDVVRIGKCSSGLFTKSIEELQIAAQEIGIEMKDAFSISVRIENNKDVSHNCEITQYVLNRFGLAEKSN